MRKSAPICLGIVFTCIHLAIFDHGAISAPLCGSNEPWGEPAVTDGHPIVSVCHEGYASGLDIETHEPRWVSYELTAEHDLGCYPRAGLRFKVDQLAPGAVQGKPSDYAHSGYDLGHMAPNEDFAWSKNEQRDTFTMANVNPQLPGLNRQGWERLEEDVRAWALQRGRLQIYVGPIYGGTSTIGADALPVPAAFFKVVVDRKANSVMGFIMPQAAVRKGLPDQWRSSVFAIEQRAGVSLPLPEQFHEDAITWTADLSAWRKKHASACQK